MGTPVEEIAEELSESAVREVRQKGSKETGIYVITFDMPTPSQHTPWGTGVGAPDGAPW